MNKIIKSKYPIKINVKDGYKYGVTTWNNDTEFGVDNFVSDTGWITTEYIIPANTYFTFNLAKSNDATLQDGDLINLVSLTSFVDFTYLNSEVNRLESEIGEQANYDYSYSGEKINFVKKGYNFSRLYSLSLPYSQGSDVYNNYLVIYFHESENSHYIKIYNHTTGELLGTINNINLGHGDVLQFSNTFYNEGDLLPLLYITSDSTPGYCYVYRIISLTTGELVKTYQIPSDYGYAGGYTCDFINNKLYCVAYTFGNVAEDLNGTNKIKITVFDMLDETEISTGVYSLAFVEQFTLPFIYCIQGQKWFDGKIFCLSSLDANVSKSKIYVIDPYKKSIISIFDNLPSDLANTECEDFSFVLSINYYMSIRTRNGVYKLQF